MNGITYDAGALIAAERRNPVMPVLHQIAFGYAIFAPKPLVRGY